MWVGVSAHVTDVGGAVPGGFSVEPMEVYGENVRFTPIKFYDAGRYRADVVDAFLTNVRLPDRTGIDLKAIMGANWIGRERMDSLLAHHGKEAVKAVHRHQIVQSERALAERLASLPDGAYFGVAHMEHDGAEDRLYSIRTTVVKEGDRITFDYTGTDGQAPGILNSAGVGSVGNVVAALATVIAPDIPFNEGVLHPVDIISPLGTVVNAEKPAPISGATVYGAWFGTDAMLEALNYLIAGNPETEQRRSGPWGSWTFAWLHCKNQYGNPWFFNVFTAGSGGASAMSFRDGEPAMMGIQTVGSFTANIEDYEQQSPVLFLQRGLAGDTGGAGRYRGGLALDSYCVPWDTDKWDVVAFHNRLSTPSSSVSGGLPGSGSAIRFTRDIGAKVASQFAASEYPAVHEFVAASESAPTRGRCAPVMPRDGYYLRATGGPGYGDPLMRPLEEVGADVRRGFVSSARAHSAYGVVVDDRGTVDTAATERLREAAREERSAWPLGREHFAELYEASRESVTSPDLAGLDLRILGEYLEFGGAEGYRCRQCGHRFCGGEDNWKWHARVQERLVTEEVIQAPIKTRPQGDLVLRQYACPGCRVQVDTEVALPAEAPRWNFRPLQVWRAQQSSQAS
jgi:N-methylhydantoinase B